MSGVSKRARNGPQSHFDICEDGIPWVSFFSVQMQSFLPHETCDPKLEPQIRLGI